MFGIHIHRFVTYDSDRTSWGAILKYQRCRCGEERTFECVPF